MSRERNRVWVGWVRAVTALLIVAATAATFIPLLPTNLWWLRTLSFARMQVACTLIALLLISLALPDRFRQTGWVCTAVVVTALGYQIAVVIPWTPLYGEQVHTAAAGADRPVLRVLEANVQMTNENAQRLLTEIEQADPDVVLLQEIDAWWQDHLAELYGRYPHHLSHVTQNYYGIALLSRLPLVDPQVLFLADARDPSIFAGIDVGGGTTVRFYGVHPRPPLPGQSSAERDAVLMAAALRMADEPGPQIVAGDFNAVPWSSVVRRLARIARLNDPRVGRGWFPTWKAGATFARWPLDHALCTDDLTLVDYRVLASFGGDHQPTLTTVCYAPAVAQEAPQPEEDDIRAAQRAVVVGQNRAVPSPEPAAGKQEPHGSTKR